MIIHCPFIFISSLKFLLKGDLKDFKIVFKISTEGSSSIANYLHVGYTHMSTYYI